MVHPRMISEPACATVNPGPAASGSGPSSKLPLVTNSVPAAGAGPGAGAGGAAAGGPAAPPTAHLAGLVGPALAAGASLVVGSERDLPRAKYRTTPTTARNAAAPAPSSTSGRTDLPAAFFR